MDKAYKELEEIKSAMEKLTTEYRAKSELSESLRRAHSEQLANLHEAKMEIEKQARELNEKSDEISLARQMYEDLKSSLHEKESALKHLSSTNDQLRNSCEEKLLKVEGENRELVLALDEANAKTGDQEQKMHAYREEIEGIRGLLSESQRKCSDAEWRVQAAKEVRKREGVLMKLEQDNAKVQEQLKWKIEQFRHLEEAYEKLQDQFHTAKKEWELEKSTLVDEVCSLQTNLDSQTRVAGDLRFQLQMCNQALAHEESRRKLLEIQMSESKACYENVVTEYEDARLKIDGLTARRDDEIASLRNSLATRETLFKESEFHKVHLEQENQELRASLKDLQEAQINKVGAAASLKNLRQKFKSLEQAHRECPATLKALEAEWSSRTEKLEKDFDECLSKLGFKDKQLQELQAELEGSHSSTMHVKLENEEISIMLMVLLSKFSEVRSGLEMSKVEMDLCTAEVDERIALLTEIFLKKNSALVQAHAEIKREHETLESLLKRVDSLESIEQQYFLRQKELNGYKEMLEESSRHVNRLKEQASQKECALREDIRKISDALDAANSAFAEKTKEVSKVEYELQHWKSIAERMRKSKLDAEVEMKSYQDEIQSIRRELEISLIAKMEAEKALEQGKESSFKIIEEKNKKLEDLQQQLEKDFASQEFEALVHTKSEIEQTFERENESFLRIAEDKDKILEGTRGEIALLEQEFARAEIEAVVTLQQERCNFLQITKEREEEIAYLKKQILSLEQEFTRSLETAITLELEDKQFEVDMLYEGWEKTLGAHFLDAQELKYKNLVIAELEEEIEALNQKLESEEKVLSDTKKHIKKLKSESEMERSERERERARVEDELNSMQSDVENLQGQEKELKAKIEQLHEVIACLSSERQILAHQMMGFSDIVGEISHKDEELMRSWERVSQRAEDVEEFKGVELYGKNNLSPRTKAGFTPQTRLPWKEIQQLDIRSTLFPHP